MLSNNEVAILWQLNKQRVGSIARIVPPNDGPDARSTPFAFAVASFLAE
jgi:hypothetical protein